MSPPSISADIRSQIATAKSENRCANFPVIKLQPKKGSRRCDQSVTFYGFWTYDEKSSALRSGHKDPFTYERNELYVYALPVAISLGLLFDLRGGIVVIIGPVAHFFPRVTSGKRRTKRQC